MYNSWFFDKSKGQLKQEKTDRKVRGILLVVAALVVIVTFW